MVLWQTWLVICDNGPDAVDPHHRAVIRVLGIVGECQAMRQPTAQRLLGSPSIYQDFRDCSGVRARGNHAPRTWITQIG
jgi:hypothetical protein